VAAVILGNRFFFRDRRSQTLAFGYGRYDRPTLATYGLFVNTIDRKS